MRVKDEGKKERASRSIDALSHIVHIVLEWKERKETNIYMVMRGRKVGEQANRLTYVHIIYEVATIQQLNTKTNKPID